MSFAVDLNAMPDPLEVEFDGGSFTLFHAYLNADERAEAVQSLGSEGLRGATDVLWGKISGWKGVNKPDGTPQVMLYKQDDGSTTSFLPVVMGRIPWVAQIVTVLKQFALNGVALARVRQTLDAFVSDKAELERIEAMMADFFKSRGGQPGGTSTGSCTTATSPSPQG